MSAARPHSCILDASALLALLHEEPGAGIVEPLLEEAVISSINWSEVVQKSLVRGVELDGLREDLEALGLVIAPFAIEDAESSALLHGETARFGLSGRSGMSRAIEQSRDPGAHGRPGVGRTGDRGCLRSFDTLTVFGAARIASPTRPRRSLPTFGDSTIPSLADASIPAF